MESQACKAAQENLKRSQQKMKEPAGKGANEWQLRTGDKVLILLPVPDEPWRAKFCGPYEVKTKVNDLIMLCPHLIEGRQRGFVT